MKLEDITFEKYKELFEKWLILINYNNAYKMETLDFYGEIMISKDKYKVIQIDTNSGLDINLFKLDNNNSNDQYINYFKESSHTVYLIPSKYKDMVLNDTSGVALEIILDKISKKEFVKLK